jgi:hypothetical protein
MSSRFLFSAAAASDEDADDARRSGGAGAAHDSDSEPDWVRRADAACGRAQRCVALMRPRCDAPRS